MKTLGNIHVIWRGGKGRRRIVVGIIKRNASNGVTFNYIENGVEEAYKEGYTPDEAFPDTSRVYFENVLNVFSQRLMQIGRHDVDDFYDFWKVDKGRLNDFYYMLSYTQGILPTDSLEFLADFNPVKGLSFVTEIAGLSTTKIPSEKLSVGDILRYEIELGNPVDKNAVKLLKGDLNLGYVKMIHCRTFVNSKKELSVKVQHIEKNGVLNRVFIHVTN